MVFSKRSGDKVVIIAVVFLLGMADAVHIRVFGHSQPETIRLPAGQKPRHTGTVDGRHDPVLRFELALRKIQPALGIHDIGLGSVEDRHTVYGAGHGAPVSEMPGMRCIGHRGGVICHGKGAIAQRLGGSGHLRKGVVGVGGAQCVGVQVCDHLHGMKKPLFTL